MKISEVRKKLDDNTFSDPIPIGAKGENIDLEEGINLEEKLKILQNQMANLQTILVWEEVN